MLRTGNVEAGRMAKAEPRTAESPDKGYPPQAAGLPAGGHHPEVASRREYPPGRRRKPTTLTRDIPRRSAEGRRGLEDTAGLTVEVQAGTQEGVGDTDVVADGDDDVQRSGLSSCAVVVIIPQAIQSNSTIA